MSDQAPQLISIDEKMAALITLLPTLKAEICFAGTDQSSPLFQRINQLVDQLKQAHRLAISSPFSDDSDINDPISLLKQYQCLHAIYHSDGAGHVQVQILENTQPFSLQCLLAAIDSKDLWDACFKMFQQQPATWLLNVAEQLENSASYHTRCQLKLAQQLSERQHSIGLMQNADQW
ncbi:hypothetical protein M0C34_09785 [Agarivorans sp. TSD2052]|uniref:hypothetical protein n=1 Tax=Agarivorans sp. TSD2052 TaxID=2937286 RepID=UPI00200D4191|nr:hypothetical protein [Agarivorans sp. TSD2052]UPW20520.1 hypothetical protein M0C34_09785 [Agarivorans sp. TSD2052]